LFNQFSLQRPSLATLTGCQTFYDHLRQHLRRSPIIISALFLFLLRGRGAETMLSEANLIPKNTPLWTESMLWDKQVSLSSGLGYNDNVLLSAFNPRGSGFFVNGLDFIVMRMPLDGWQVVGSLATGTMSGPAERIHLPPVCASSEICRTAGKPDWKRAGC
jgi:hypothetical protein